MFAVEARQHSEQDQHHSRIRPYPIFVSFSLRIQKRYVRRKDTEASAEKQTHVHAGRFGFSPRKRLVIAVNTNVSELQIGTAFEISMDAIAMSLVCQYARACCAVWCAEEEGAVLVYASRTR